MEIKCLDCYSSSIGSHLIRCGQDKTWVSSDRLICSEATCATFTPITESNTVVDNAVLSQYPVGHELAVKCLDGFINIDSNFSSTVARCLGCNQWSEVKLDCCRSCPDIFIDQNVLNFCVGSSIVIDAIDTNLTCLNCEGKPEWRKGTCEESMPFYRKYPEYLYIPIIAFISLLLFGAIGCLAYRQHVHYTYPKRTVSPTSRPILTPDNLSSTERGDQLVKFNETFVSDQSLVSTRDLVIMDIEHNRNSTDSTSKSHESIRTKTKPPKNKTLVKRRLSEISF